MVAAGHVCEEDVKHVLGDGDVAVEEDPKYVEDDFAELHADEAEVAASAPGAKACVLHRRLGEVAGRAHHLRLQAPEVSCEALRSKL